MTDERESLPSASGAHRWMNCPGSHTAEAACPADEGDAYAAHGDRIHQALAGLPVTPPLSDEEADTYERSFNQETHLLDRYFPNASRAIHREQRLWLFRQMKKASSAKLDFCAVGESTILIIEYKTLFGDQIESARNPQLRLQAVLAADEHATVTHEKVVVAIVQPWKSGTPDVCEYSPADIGTARGEVFAALDRVNQPDAPRIPGPWCKFCRAKLSCPEAQAQLSVVATVGQSLALMDNARLADFLNLIADCKPLIKAAESEAKKRLGDEQELPGWELSPGKSQREITDTQRVFAQASELHKVTADEFTAICGVGLGDLEKLLRRKSKERASELKGKALKNAVDTVLDGCVEVKTSARSLHRVGAALEDEPSPP